MFFTQIPPCQFQNKKLEQKEKPMKGPQALFIR